jgi:hypothetical protein
VLPTQFRSILQDFDNKTMEEKKNTKDDISEGRPDYPNLYYFIIQVSNIYWYWPLTIIFYVYIFTHRYAQYC